MSLVSMSPLLSDAKDHRYGVGAFNVFNLEMAIGVIRAAERLRAPVILQLAEVHTPAAPLMQMGPLMVDLATRASVPVAVHFDHGNSYREIVRALHVGFSSVMYDGALTPFEENVQATTRCVELAHALEATCEAELGYVGDGSDDPEKIESMLTDPEQAARFATLTGVDALAVAIGNAHGAYTHTPRIRHERLRAIAEATSVPLVLHGGSGITPDDFRQCVANGICKINVGTAIQNGIMARTREFLAAHPHGDYLQLNEEVKEAADRVVGEHIEIFGGGTRA